MQPHNEYFADPLHRIADRCASIERAATNVLDNINPDSLQLQLSIAIIEISAMTAELAKLVRAIAEYCA